MLMKLEAPVTWTMKEEAEFAERGGVCGWMGEDEDEEENGRP